MLRHHVPTLLWLQCAIFVTLIVEAEDDYTFVTHRRYTATLAGPSQTMLRHSSFHSSSRQRNPAHNCPWTLQPSCLQACDATLFRARTTQSVARTCVLTRCTDAANAGASGVTDEDEFLVTLNEPEPEAAAEAVRAACVDYTWLCGDLASRGTRKASGGKLCAVCMAGR